MWVTNKNLGCYFIYCIYKESWSNVMINEVMLWLINLMFNHVTHYLHSDWPQVTWSAISLISYKAYVRCIDNVRVILCWYICSHWSMKLLYSVICTSIILVCWNNIAIILSLYEVTTRLLVHCSRVGNNVHQCCLEH